MQLVNSVDRERSHLRVRAEPTQPAKPMTELRDVDLPVLRRRDAARIQPKVKQSGVQRLVVEVALHAAKIDGDEVARLWGDSEFILDGLLHRPVA